MKLKRRRKNETKRQRERCSLELGSNTIEELGVRRTLVPICSLCWVSHSVSLPSLVVVVVLFSSRSLSARFSFVRVCVSSAAAAAVVRTLFSLGTCAKILSLTLLVRCCTGIVVEVILVGCCCVVATKELRRERERHTDFCSEHTHCTMCVCVLVVYYDPGSGWACVYIWLSSIREENEQGSRAGSGRETLPLSLSRSFTITRSRSRSPLVEAYAAPRHPHTSRSLSRLPLNWCWFFRYLSLSLSWLFLSQSRRPSKKRFPFLVVSRVSGCIRFLRSGWENHANNDNVRRYYEPRFWLH